MIEGSTDEEQMSELSMDGHAHVYIYMCVRVCVSMYPSVSAAVSCEHHIHRPPPPRRALISPSDPGALNKPRRRASPLIRNTGSPSLGRMIDGFPKQDLRAASARLWTGGERD